MPRLNEPADAAADNATAEKSSSSKAVVFADLHYVRRTVEVAGSSLLVERGQVEVTDQAVIDALDETFGFVRVK